MCVELPPTFVAIAVVLVIAFVLVVDLDNNEGDPDDEPPTADVDAKHEDHKDTMAPPKGTTKTPAAAASKKTTGESEAD